MISSKENESSVIGWTTTQVCVGNVEVGRHELRLGSVQTHSGRAEVAEMLRICGADNVSDRLTLVVRAKLGGVEAANVLVLHVFTITQKSRDFKGTFMVLS